MFGCQYGCINVLVCGEFIREKWSLHGLIVSVSLLEHGMTHCILMVMYVCIIYLSRPRAQLDDELDPETRTA